MHCRAELPSWVIINHIKISAPVIARGTYSRTLTVMLMVQCAIIQISMWHHKSPLWLYITSTQPFILNLLISFTKNTGESGIELKTPEVYFMSFRLSQGKVWDLTMQNRLSKHIGMHFNQKQTTAVEITATQAYFRTKQIPKDTFLFKKTRNGQMWS